MEHPSDDSVSLAMSPSAANLEAEVQQQAIIQEEERSTDALEHGRAEPPVTEDSLPNDYLALVGRGLALTAAQDELRATTQKIRAAATSARESALITRNTSLSLRRLFTRRY